MDFGLAEYCPKGGYLNEYCGTCYYMAPEVIEERNYTENVDVWAIGVIAYELLAGDILFNGRTVEEINDKITNGKY